jgi:hypothetical protein
MVRSVLFVIRMVFRLVASGKRDFNKYNAVNLLIAQADDNRGSKTRLVTVAISMFRSQSRPELVPRYH